MHYQLSIIFQVTLSSLALVTRKIGPSARKISYILDTSVRPLLFYARYLSSRDALGLKAERDDRVSCIQLFSNLYGLNAVLVELDELCSGMPSLLKSDNGKLLRIAILYFVTWYMRHGHVITGDCWARLVVT